MADLLGRRGFPVRLLWCVTTLGLILLGLTLSTMVASADDPAAPINLAVRLQNAPLPPRVPFDLAVRLRNRWPNAPTQAPAPVTPLQAGAQDNFWILDQHQAQLFQTPATLRLVTEHAYWFVQTDMLDRSVDSGLEVSASVFETTTYPLIERYFGPLPTVDISGDTHIVFLLANVPGVAAYFSSADAYPRTVNPRSNEHDLIYVNLNSLRPGQAAFDSTVTHELQHMAQFNHCPAQEGWVDEGASELAMRIAGYEGSPPLAFAGHPETQLTVWSPGATDATTTRHYQAAYLFLRYVAERSGGWDALPRLFQTCARGEDLFSAFLASEPIAPDVDSLFADWAVANLLQDPTLADGRYGYAGGSFHASVTGSLARQTPFAGSIPQFASNYVDLPVGGGSVRFNGDPLVALLSAPLDTDGVWWSNRGDAVDTRLTRPLDLRGVSQATLEFKAWYDVEDQFDFVYLSASTDGGRTWQVLPGVHGAPDNATGNNYGAGWTGSSANSWVDEQVDLSAFSGQQVLIRFEYITDQGYNGQGFALRDVQVPQIGLSEVGAVESAWAAEGWLRVDGPVPERWNLRLVRWTSAGVSVEPVGVAPDGSTTILLDEAAQRQTLVIAPTTRRTLVEGAYTLAAIP